MLKILGENVENFISVESNNYKNDKLDLLCKNLRKYNFENCYDISGFKRRRNDSLGVKAIYCYRF